LIAHISVKPSRAKDKFHLIIDVGTLNIGSGRTDRRKLADLGLVELVSLWFDRPYVKQQARYGDGAQSVISRKSIAQSARLAAAAQRAR
jgi:hypothetical protein